VTSVETLALNLLVVLNISLPLLMIKPITFGCILHKAEVFDRFVEWKALVEKQSGQKFKGLWTDNGGEYTSNKFEEFLKREGVLHERIVPKTPEQNGVADSCRHGSFNACRLQASSQVLG